MNNEQIKKPTIAARLPQEVKKWYKAKAILLEISESQIYEAVLKKFYNENKDK